MRECAVWGTLLCVVAVLLGLGFITGAAVNESYNNWDWTCHTSGNAYDNTIACGWVKRP